jgi:WD40 repeat protein
MGLVLLVMGCVSVSDFPAPEPFTPSPSTPTLTTPTDQNTAMVETTVKFIIDRPSVDQIGGVEALAFSPDGRTLASLYKNGTIVLWNVDTHQTSGSFAGGGEIGELGMMSGFTFSPDGKFLVARANGGAPILWDIATGQSLEVERDLSRSDGMALSPDGKLLAYGKCEELNAQSHCGQYEIILWDMTTHQPVGQSLSFPVGAPAPLGLLFSPDGKTLAAMSSGTTGSGRVELFDVTTGRSMISPLEGQAQFSGMAFGPDGNSMALGNTAGVIYIWDVKSQQASSQLAAESGLVMGLTFSPNGKTLAARILIPSTESIPYEKIALWDVDSLQPIGQPLTSQVATGSAAGLISTAFSPDGMTLASGTSDGSIIFWRLPVSSQP